MAKAEEIIRDFLMYNANSFNNLKTASPDLSKAFGNVVAELAKKYVGIQIGTTQPSKTPTTTASGYREDFENLEYSNVDEFFESFIYEDVTTQQEQEYLRKWGFSLKIGLETDSKVYLTKSVEGLNSLLIMSSNLNKGVKLWYLDEYNDKSLARLSSVTKNNNSTAYNFNYEEQNIKEWANVYEPDFYDAIIRISTKPSVNPSGYREDFENLTINNAGLFFESYNQNNISNKELDKLLKDNFRIIFNRIVYFTDSVRNLEYLLRSFNAINSQVALEFRNDYYLYQLRAPIYISEMDYINKDIPSSQTSWNFLESSLLDWAKKYDNFLYIKLISLKLSKEIYESSMTAQKVGNYFTELDWDMLTFEEKKKSLQENNFILRVDTGYLKDKSFIINRYDSLSRVLQLLPETSCSIKIYDKDFGGIETAYIEPTGLKKMSNISNVWHFEEETLLQFTLREQPLIYEKLLLSQGIPSSNIKPKAKPATQTAPNVPETFPYGLTIVPNTGNRPSPTQSASSWGYENSYAKGNDNQWYTIGKTKTGTKRWVQQDPATPTPEPTAMGADYATMSKQELELKIGELEAAKEYLDASDPEYQELIYEIENAQDELDKRI